MKDIFLLDGGVGQEIYKRAGKPSTPLWSTQIMIDNPDIVKEVHKDFIKAGSTIITTNSYTCTPTRLKRDGNIDLFEKLQIQALDIAIQARNELGYSSKEISIAGCLPPLVASYVDNDHSFNQLKNEYEQIVNIQDPHVDLYLIETIYSIKEAAAALEATQNKNKPVWLSFTLSDDNLNFLRSGESIEDAIKALEDFFLDPLDALLFNCSFPEIIDQGMISLKDLSIPYGGFANGFTSINALKPGGVVNKLEARFDLDEKKYASYVMQWIDKGATIVGGCCEVGPSYIKYICKELKSKGYGIVCVKKKSN